MFSNLFLIYSLASSKIYGWLINEQTSRDTYSYDFNPSNKIWKLKTLVWFLRKQWKKEKGKEQVSYDFNLLPYSKQKIKNKKKSKNQTVKYVNVNMTTN